MRTYDINQFIHHIAVLLGVTLIVYVLLNMAKYKGKYKYLLMKHSIIISTLPVFILPSKVEYSGSLIKINYGFPIRFITQFKMIDSIDIKSPRYITFFSLYGKPILGDIAFHVLNYLLSIYIIYMTLKFADKRFNLYKVDKTDG